MSAVVTLKKGEGRMVKSGGMWIFDNEIESVMGTFENGDLVLVHDFDGYRMGIPEKDGRHLILSRGIWRGRFPAGTGY